MKIAIVTLIGEYNNGNRLQNYALQQALKKVIPNAKVNTINLNPRYNLIKTCKFIAKKILRPQPSIKNFRNFNKNVVFTTKKYNEIKEDYKSLVDKYDYFVTGSDQVWNMGYYKNEKLYFLDWVPTEKKLSYAASIGNNNLSPERQGKFKNLLSTFNHISVREKHSEDMLKTLGINATTNIDPTLLLTREDWDKVEKKPLKANLAKEYVFVCMLGTMTDEYKNKINLLAKLYDLQIINLFDKKNREIYKSGPSEFVHLIKNAQFVVTDSFHCIVFSIIYNKPFFHFNRSEKNENSSSKNINSRLENLERIFNTKFMTHEDITEENAEKLLKFQIENKDAILEKERERSFEYLKNALTPKELINLDDKKFKCTGCGLCANICPQKAIKIVKNEKGFYQYQIDKKKCNNCGACLKLCPANKKYKKINFKETTILGAKNEQPIQDNSSSAGVFGKIASQIINNKGVVYGLSYNEKNQFSRITKIEDIELIKGSKYYQANLSPLYPAIEKDLKDNKQVLICGTPCQIAGIKQKFGHFENLTAVSIVCHGTPSKDVLEEFCKETYNAIPDKINFRKKNPYWQNYSIEFIFDNKSLIEKAHDNEWFKGFLSNYFLNNCCYNCNFAGNQYGADIILGDFWGIKDIDSKFYDQYGTSLCICVTNKGKELLNSSKDNLITKEYKNINLITHYNPCIIKTNYGKQKEYAQEIFFINKQNGKTFKENISEINKSLQTKKQSFIKRAIRKLKRIIFKV